MDEHSYPPRTLISWFWKNYVRRTWPLLIVAGFFMIIEGGSLGALSYMVRPMFDQLFIGGERSSAYFIAFAVGGIFIARGVAGFSQRIVMETVGRIVSTRLQGDFFRHILTLDSAFFTANSPGSLMERLRGDTEDAISIISTTFSTFGRDVIALISLLAVAFTTDWVWTLVVLVGAPLLVLPIRLLQKYIRLVSRRLRNLAGMVTVRLDESLHGMDTIKLNVIEKREAGRFQTLINIYARASVRASAAQAGVPALMDIVAAIGFMCVLIVGGVQIIDGEKTVGDFMAFFTAIALLFEPARRLGMLSAAWQKAIVSQERVYNLFQQRPNIISPTEPADLPTDPKQADLTIENVHFSYVDNPVLNGLSFTAKAGQTTALVGASGAGKTTVFKLLSRLIDPTTGQVSLNGTDIREFDIKSLRQLFSVVTQDTLLFDDSLRENVELGRETNKAEMTRALDAAHVSDFIPNLQNGVDSQVGPRGSALSGGQRQRVAIARALLRDCPFLLLDEATSALDTKSEAIVQAALEHLAEGRTTLVIAHRLSTVRNADKIVVMDKGQVVDQGSHSELMARGGLYANLYQIQFSDAVKD